MDILIKISFIRAFFFQMDILIKISFIRAFFYYRKRILFGENFFNLFESKQKVWESIHPHKHIYIH